MPVPAAEPLQLSEQLLHVLGAHVIPHLKLPEVQALGHASKQLYNLMNDGIPGSSWLRAATLSLLPGHPLLAFDPKGAAQSFPRKLHKLAALHKAITSGQLASVQEMALGHAAWAQEPWASAVSPSGRWMVQRQCSQLVVASLPWRLPANGEDD